MDEWREDGGPAFPMASGQEPRVNEITHYNEGMSLRDWFAGMALAGWMANQWNNGNEDQSAESCYALADAMLKARDQ